MSGVGGVDTQGTVGRGIFPTIGRIGYVLG